MIAEDVKAIWKSDELFAGIFEGAPIAVCVTDAATATIVRANTEACLLVGLEPGEMAGRSLLEFSAPDDIDLTVTALEEVFVQGGRAQIQTKFTTVQGELRWAVASLTGYLDESGQPDFVVNMIHDVTDLKTAEEKAVASKTRAEEATRAKEEFLASMSHELRTPLNAVIGLNSILRKRTFGDLSQKQAEYVDQVDASAKHLLALINDLLDLSRLDSIDEKLNKTALNASELLAKVTALVREAATARRLTICCSVPDDLFVYGDERRIKQILINLLSNAVKFTDEGGEIGVDVSSSATATFFEVWDNGRGIPADSHERIFMPFEQVERASEGDGLIDRGTGLGLALTARLVEIHGGNISLSSEAGRGSRFVVELPAQPDVGLTPSPEETNPEDLQRVLLEYGESITVLLAEDNLLNQTVIADYLRAAGVTVEIADDGVKAVTAARDVLPDVILMDVQMPKLDGLEATRKIKADPKTSHIPVIALTALAMRSDAEHCLRAGCADYISKPVDPDVVLRMVLKMASLDPGQVDDSGHAGIPA